MGRRQPFQDIPRAVASCWQNESAAGRGAPGRKRSVSRLVGCQQVFLDLMRYSNLEHKQVLPR